MSHFQANDAIFETFKDQFVSDVQQIEPLVLSLVHPGNFDESINNLFRIYHNHKALSAFLNITPIHKVTERVENILNHIRESKKIHDQTEIDWLLAVADQMQTWADELELGVSELSLADPEIFTMLKLREKKASINQSLRHLNLLYLEENLHQPQRYLPVFDKIFKKVTHMPSTERLIATVVAAQPDLIMISDTFINPQTLSVLFKANGKREVPMIALTQNNQRKHLVKLINQGVHYYLHRPIGSNPLKRTLYSIVKSHYTKKKVIISTKKIRNFIDNLDPLSDTLKEIQRICDDPGSAITDLIKVVKKDPVTSGIILNATKFPIYGLKNITSIDQAVSTFGKRTVKALTLSGLSQQLQPADFSMYGMDEKRFLEIAYLRMRLMSTWMGKVNPERIDILSISALLGNLGQMLIAKEISAQHGEKAFFTLLQDRGPTAAEETILQTNTTAVTADILYYWQMPSELVDSISYSDAPMEAVEEIRFLALANHIIYSLIPINSADILPLHPTIRLLMKEAALDVETLEEAIKEVTLQKEKL